MKQAFNTIKRRLPEGFWINNLTGHTYVCNSINEGVAREVVAAGSKH